MSDIKGQREYGAFQQQIQRQKLKIRVADVYKRQIEDCAALCSKLGLQFVELNMNLPQYQTVSLDTNRLEAVAKRYGIYFTIHLDENLNVSDFNPFVAQAYTRTVLETIRIARRLNIPVLNMHLSEGVYFTLPDRKIFLYEQYRCV